MRRNYLFFCLTAFISILLLSGCGTSGDTNPWNDAPAASAATTPTATPLPNTPSPVSASPLPSAPSFAQAPVGNTAKVGILLPLSGPSGQTGQALLNAAQLALFDLKAESNFELMPRDTKGNPNDARIAAESVIKDGAQLLIGPLFSAEAKAVSAVALQNNISALSFSTDRQAASGNGYIMGFLPQTQIERVLSYAQTKGLSRIALIAPRDAYGDMSAQVFDQTLRARNLNNVGVLRYDGSSPAPDIIKNFMGTTTAIDAVLIAASPETAARISAQLTAQGFPPARLQRLGTGLWDQPNITRLIELSGAWFASTAPATRARFESQYQATYGTAPPRIASLAYDATALAIVLNRTGASYNRQNLQNTAGFAGVDGVFRFGVNGIVERHLAILEITPQTVRVIEPAATNF
jgi:branched-chain amino acid transport system substrate-binding protein